MNKLEKLIFKKIQKKLMLNFFNKRVFIIFIFPLILGGITVLGFQPFNLFFVNFFSLPLLFFTIIYVKKNLKVPIEKNLFLKIYLFWFIFWFWFFLFWYFLDCTFINF